MQFFPYFPERRCTSSGDMARALHLAGVQFAKQKEMPILGLVQIHFTGAWSASQNLRWAATKSHWIAVDREWIYDALNHDWTVKGHWSIHTLPLLLKAYPRSQGFSILNAFKLPPQMFDPIRQVPGFERRFSKSAQSPSDRRERCNPTGPRDCPLAAK